MLSPELHQFIKILNLKIVETMSNNQDAKFADGFIFKRNPNAPDFVIGQLSVKVEDAINFLKANAKNGWVNIDIKRGRSGKEYLQLSTYEPKQPTNTISNDSPF